MIKSHNLVMQMDFQIRMVHACDNRILLPQVREKKLQLFYFPKNEGCGNKPQKISPRDTYLVMFINQPFSNNAKKTVGCILSTATCFI